MMTSFQAPRGWDEDQELDYSEAVRRREEREMSEPRESGDNGEGWSFKHVLHHTLTPSHPHTLTEVTPDLFKYSRPTSFPVRSLGHISPLTPSPSSQQAPPPPSSEGQTALLSIIDKAQVNTHTLFSNKCTLGVCVCMRVYLF